MGRRTIRIVVVVLLFATAAIAWRMLRDIDRQHDGLASEADAIAARLDRIAESLHGIGAAQLTYVAPGQPGGASFERVSTLLRDYQEDIMAVGPALQSPDVLERMKQLHGLVMGGTPEDADRFFAEESQRWKVIIEKTGAKIE